METVGEYVCYMWWARVNSFLLSLSLFGTVATECCVSVLNAVVILMHDMESFGYSNGFLIGSTEIQLVCHKIEFH